MEMNFDIGKFVIVERDSLEELEDRRGFCIRSGIFEDFLIDLMLDFVDENFELVSGNDKRYDELSKKILDSATKMVNNETYYNSRR